MAHGGGGRKRSISLQTTNPLNPLLTVPRLQLFSWLHMCVKKKKEGGETNLITAVFLINNAMLVFQSSWGGPWELCSKPYLSFYNDTQACSLDHNTPGTI